MAQDIRLIQLNNYIRPKVEENKSKNWVLNGKNNSFYHYMIQRYNGSTTHSAIVNSYIDMIYGKGIGARNSFTNTADWLRFKVIMKDEDVRRIVSDFVMFNEFSAQVIKAKNKTDLGAIKHTPKERIAPSIENEDEEIETYFYSRDWSSNKYTPLPFATFGTSKDEIEIYNGMPYKAGKTYFSDPDYLAGIPYMEMEEEISNYYINHIKNGLSFGYIINIPDGNSLSEEEKDDLEYKIKAKLTGSSNAGKFVLSFNGRDAEITVTPLTVNDAHKQWEYLTSESRQQIMTSHRVVSPILFGIKDNTGFGNNADELTTAREQLIKYVIEPKQRFIIDGIKQILEYYDINLDLYFKPLQEVATVTLSDEKKKTDLDLFIDLGEDEDLDNWDVVDCEKWTDESIDIQFANIPERLPLAPSELDNEVFKVRFQYAGNLNPKRDFCQKMIGLKGGVFRKEDIDKASERAVNPGWGPKGSNTYDILKYKGGGDCHHFWQRKVYLKKGNKNITIEKAQQMIKDLKELGIKTEVPNSGEPLATKKPTDMPYNGFLPTNKRFQ